MTKSDLIPKGVFCLGESVVDHWIRISPDDLTQYQITKDITTERKTEIFNDLEKRFPIEKTNFGGAAANVAKALGFLGHPVGLFGHYSDDELGNTIREGMKRFNIEDLHIFRSGFRSAKVMACIHPDASRTMIGDVLDDGMDWNVNEVNWNPILKYEYLLFEGYRAEFVNHYELTKAGVDRFYEQKKKIIGILSDRFYVPGYKERLEYLINKCSIITGNEDEFIKFFNKSNREDLLNYLEKQNFELVAVTLAHEGACIIKDGKRIYIPAETNISVINTVGAGDFFTAGLLYGYLRDYPIDACGKLGSIFASHMIQKLGSFPEEEVKEKVFNLLKEKQLI